MTAEPIGRTSGGAFRRGWYRAEPLLAVALLALIVEVVTRVGIVDSDLIPPPTSVIAELVSDIPGKILGLAIWQTFWTWIVAMVLAISIAVPIGLLLGSSAVMDSGSRLTREFFRSVPTVAAIPFLILLLGVNERLTIVLVVFTASWPLIIQTVAGVEDVDPVTRETARIYGLGKFAEFTRIVIPSALPQILTGVRLAAGLGLAVSVAASIFAGGQGVGAAITSAANAGQVDLMYARILVVGLIALGVSLALSQLERRVLHWHPSTRESLAQ